MKIVGRLRTPTTPEESLRRAEKLIWQAKQLASIPRPRGYVFKAQSWEIYEAWKKQQTNPRLW